MEYTKFVTEVERIIKSKLVEGTTTEVRTITKNNGHIRIGIVIIQEGSNVSPTIYMESFYQAYECGRALFDIVDDVLDVYEKAKLTQNFDIQALKDYARIKNRIVCRAINREKNEQWLQKVPYMECLNLAIVCYIRLDIPSRGEASVVVDEEMQKMWGISKDQLFWSACTNTERILPYSFHNLAEMAAKSMGHSQEEDKQIYVLTNQEFLYGAVTILYTKMTKYLGEVLGEDYYVIPSSIHEVMVVPLSSGLGRQELESMLRDINQTSLDPEEVLSDQVYYYSRKADKLIV